MLRGICVNQFKVKFKANLKSYGGADGTSSRVFLKSLIR